MPQFLYTEQACTSNAASLGFESTSLIQIDISYVERLKWKDA
jgi:hypothetical protein